MACGPGASARCIGVALRAAVYAASRCPCPCEFKPAPPGPPAVIINYRRRRCPAQQSLGAVTWTSTRMSSRWHQALAPINGLAQRPPGGICGITGLHTVGVAGWGSSRGVAPFQLPPPRPFHQPPCSPPPKHLPLYPPPLFSHPFPLSPPPS